MKCECEDRDNGPCPYCRIEQLEFTISNRCDEVERCHTVIAELEAEVAELKEALEEADSLFNERVEYWQDEAHEQSKEKEVLYCQIADLTNQLSEHKKYGEEYYQRYNDEFVKTRELTDQYKSLQQSYADVWASRESLQEQLATANAQLSEANENDYWYYRYQSVAQENVNLQEQLATVTEQRDEWKEYYEEMQSLDYPTKEEIKRMREAITLHLTWHEHGCAYLDEWDNREGKCQ